MKFPDVPSGARFRWQGQTFVKETALVARNVENGQKAFIARSAQVELLSEGGESDETFTPDPQPDTCRVREAFDKFWAHCCDNLRSLEQGNSNIADVRGDLEKARARFLHTLGD